MSLAFENKDLLERPLKTCEKLCTENRSTPENKIIPENDIKPPRVTVSSQKATVGNESKQLITNYLNRNLLKFVLQACFGTRK